MERVLAPVPSSLVRLAYNFWWSWQPDGPELFRDVDPDRWEMCNHNPVRLLVESPRLREAITNPRILARAAALDEALRADLSAPFADAPPASPQQPIAFICAEYGVHQSLPIYSGVLGVLAGDYLKEASDQRLPLVAVGFLYR